MDIHNIDYFFNKFKFGEDNFHNLMAKRVREVLLVSSFYDAYIFEQDGRLSEQIFGEYQQLNLSTAPRITNVPTAEKAIGALKEKKYDLVVTMMRIGETIPYQMTKEIKEIDPTIPILLLLNSIADVALINRNPDKMKYIDDSFIWTGNAKVFLAMLKYIEDKSNIEYDTTNGLVRVILLVEDSIQYYSMFLPELYEIILRQTQLLIKDEVNEVNKRLRMRARPKVILVHTYEDAVEIYNRFKEYIICIISDVRFPRGGNINPKAGIELIKQLKEDNCSIPILLQSSEQENEDFAHALGVSFMNKNITYSLSHLRSFIYDNLGFGDFIFRDANNNIYGKAKTLNEFEECLRTIPDVSLLYHSENNHFSAWLIAHSHIQIAKRIRPIGVLDFSSVSHLREYLMNTFEEVREIRTKGRIINFDPSSLRKNNNIIRLVDGSLGGKGRGLAFINSLMVSMEFDKQYTDVDVILPTTAIIGTNEFDCFVQSHEIIERINNKSDEEIKEIFLSGSLSSELISTLNTYIDRVDYPIAVRSSGLLEDSQSQPFAGVYSTFMLPNCAEDKQVRIQQLMDAIKLVFASVFLEETRKYIEGIHYKIEEEKMAVILQEVVGCKVEDEYYPHISGVAQSFNFYPTSYLQQNDGVATIAIGLGKAVVEGERAFRFCPAYPKMDILAQEDILKNSQKDYYGIQLCSDSFRLQDGEDITFVKRPLSTLQAKGLIDHLYSIWDYENLSFTEDKEKKGLLAITFADILKYDYFPLASIVKDLLHIGTIAMGLPVEIEYAVNLCKDATGTGKPAFYILQIRPMSVDTEEINVDLSLIDKKELFLCTQKGLGNGIINDIHDIVYVKKDKFDKTRTLLMQKEIETINEKLKVEDTQYILVGPGRWGTRDPFLGIPVRWDQISQARLIIEVDLPDFVVDTSQGTHFFHNLIAMNVGYLNVDLRNSNDFINWDVLKEYDVVEETEYFIHVRASHPLIIKMDGRKGIAVVLK